LLWLHALYVVCTEGLVACYNYSKEDEKYGTYEEDQYEEQETSLESKICPVCQHNLSSREISNEARDEFDPGDDEVEQQDLLQKFDICPQCLTEMTPQTQV